MRVPIVNFVCFVSLSYLHFDVNNFVSILLSFQFSSSANKLIKMFSKRLLKIFEYRHFISELYVITPFVWNRKLRKLESCKDLRYNLWKMFYVCVFIYEIEMAVLVSRRVWSFASFNRLHFILDVFWVALIAMILSVVALIVKYRSGWAV